MAQKRYETDEEARGRLTEALKELPEAWVACRDMRHAWAVDQDFHVTIGHGAKIQEIQRALICMRGCGTHRRERFQVSRFGLEKVANYYEYPEGYQIHGVPRGVKPQSLVQGETYRRAMVKIAALQMQ